MKAQTREADDVKGVPDLLWEILTHILCLGHVFKHEALPAIWKDLASAPKRQHLTTLQRELDDTVCCVNACAGLLNITLFLDFLLDHWDNLGTGLHHFGLKQHTYAPPEDAEGPRCGWRHWPFIGRR